MDRCPRRGVISRSGIGYDNVDVAAATARGIAVCIAPDGPDRLHRRARRRPADGRGQAPRRRTRPGCGPAAGDYFGACRSVELAGSTLGLVGYGRIARRVGRVAAALDMTVDRPRPVPRAGVADGRAGRPSTSCWPAGRRHLRARPPDRVAPGGLFDAAAFARIRPGVIFVNTARGALVDQEALLAALDSGQVGRPRST